MNRDGFFVPNALWIKKDRQLAVLLCMFHRDYNFWNFLITAGLSSY